TTSQSDWYAYQLDRPDLGEGCVLFFRRPENTEPSRQVVLRRIDQDAAYHYTLTGETYDRPEPREISGRELVEFTVEIPEAPGSALLRYRRAEADGKE
ncbi:MAG: hypothetical protein HQ582_21605, partial [Planctomycetes bacterium]|nr:hypothetical protein [Planctomycetota bacterium]